MEEDRKYCVICSLIIAKENGSDGDKIGGDVEGTNKTNRLSDVFQLLLKSSSNHDQHQLNGNSFLEETFKALEDANFSLCSECSSVTSGALDSKGRAEKMELEVRSLQLKLLEMLRGLQAEMEVFNEEMSKLEDIIVIKSATVEVDQGVREKEEAVLVREEILEVVTELRFYQADLQDKLILNRVEEQSMLEVSTDEVEVDFVPEVKAESPENICDIDELIGFDASMEVDHEEENNEVEEIAPENEQGERFVGHVVGLASDEADKSENRRKNLRQRGFVWREEYAYTCTVCGEGLPTQNKLTRHLKREHGQIPGQEKAERLKRPAIRFNNEAVSEEILSKALVCMTKNVEEKDRNTKTVEERKKARQEKLALLRAQWKAIRKTMKKVKKGPTSKRKEEKSEKTARGRKKGLLQKFRKTVEKHVPLKSSGKTEPEKKEPEGGNVEQSTVPQSPNKKKRKWEMEERPGVRRSTRGQCVLNIKEVMLDMEKKSRGVQITTETET